MDSDAMDKDQNSIRHCAYRNCRSVQVKGYRDNIIFHKFPKNETISRIWAERCHRLDLLTKSPNVVNNVYKLCSKHFDDKQYHNSLRLRLIPNAVPSIFDSDSECEPRASSPDDISDPEDSDIGLQDIEEYKESNPLVLNDTFDNDKKHSLSDAPQKPCKSKLRKIKITSEPSADGSDISMLEHCDPESGSVCPHYVALMEEERQSRKLKTETKGLIVLLNKSNKQIEKLNKEINFLKVQLQYLSEKNMECREKLMGVENQSNKTFEGKKIEVYVKEELDFKEEISDEDV